MAAITMGKHHRTLARGWPLTLFPLLFAGFSGQAHALGVGEPQLLSGYAEPLRVRVPVSLDTSEERAAAEGVRADLIPEGDYSHYGVADQGIDLNAIYAASHTDGSRSWVEIGSSQPIREPVAILLLRVRLGNTLIVKEVPLLFDPKTPAAPVEVPAPAETAIAANIMPVTPPAAAAPVAAAPAASPRREHRTHHQAAAPVAAATPVSAAAPLFQLSPGMRYTSASAGLRLAESFDSLADWRRTHPQAETPAAPAATQPATEPTMSLPAAPAPQPRLPAPVPAAAPAQDTAPRPSQGSSNHDWISWLVGAAVALAALAVRRRRRREQPEAASQFIAVSASEPVAAVSTPVPEPVQDQATAPIRERLRKLSRANLDQDMARRALLVDAFLDLKRYDSAERLLKELEQDLANSAEPRPGVASVAAAVRR